MKDEIRTIRDDLLKGMLEFMEPDPEFATDNECGYEESDVEECGKIIDEYLSILQCAGNTQNSLRFAIKTTVEKLNRLNDRCDGRLIETEQREQLCDILLSSAKANGLKSEEDITEEWRQW